MQVHSQKFLFVKFLGEIPENLGNIFKYQGKFPEEMVPNVV